MSGKLPWHPVHVECGGYLAEEQTKGPGEEKKMLR